MAFRQGNVHRTATLVEICGNVFSDAGSTPAISTKRPRFAVSRRGGVGLCPEGAESNRTARHSARPTVRWTVGQSAGRLPPSPPSKRPLPSPGSGRLVCALRVRSRTGRRTAVREKQSGGLFFSPRVLPPSPSRRRKRHIAYGDFFAKVTSRSFCCASFSPTESRCAIFCGGPVFRLPVGGVYLALISPRSPPRVPVFKL